MKKALQLITAILICQMAGIVGSIFTSPSIDAWYETLTFPPLRPPNWLFGPVWILLYTLMGISVYLIYTGKKKKKARKAAVQLFAAHLVLNAVWSIVFFGTNELWLSLLIILALTAFIIALIRSFYPLSKSAAYLLVPYLLWVSFATYLNAGIWLLNA
ncbi:MAG: tryptophan-rich sensory protein [bacterium]|nr:tryptophan-rich sensory protein [bacterium]MDA1024440.1 tryptophan-rich sensory protein [bacterium]